jgi:hypothetical protein
LPAAELQKAVEKEYEMALQDRIMEETKEKKNAVEAYVYDMRNKVYCDECPDGPWISLQQYLTVVFLYLALRQVQ